MARKYSQGVFTPKNPTKYIGKGNILYRSSWELQFMMWCDKNVDVLKWASEAIRIPYRNPLTGKNTTYVPDFFVQYLDASRNVRSAIFEIKPEKHQILEKVGKNRHDQIQYILNQAKWAAANAYCKSQGLEFRILNENDLFMNGKDK